MEQSSWVLFLKYLDDLEKERESAASPAGKPYEPILRPQYRWDKWAMPRKKDGEVDHHKALTGDDLNEFVNGKLFPYLAKFKTAAESSDTIEYKIGRSSAKSRTGLQSGYNLREVLNLVDELRFQTSTEKHEMSHLYESKIKNMGNAGRNGGEYYTPRPLIRSIVKVVAPQVGETVYDAAVGSAGFLVEAFDYMKDPEHYNGKKLSVKNMRALQKDTFFGKEKKSLAFIIGTMNMILHGIEAPNIVHTSSLTALSGWRSQQALPRHESLRRLKNGRIIGIP